MQAAAISEFHFIAPLANLESIFERGILSHNEATPHKKEDISNEGVQERRHTKEIPAAVMGVAKTIHDCANVYLNAKNPMLSARRKQKESLCVLRLKPELMHLPGAVISDRNAATNAAQFYKAVEGVQKVAREILFGKYWSSKFNDPATNERNGQIRCAELLLPTKIHPSYIGGMYVVSEAVKQAVIAKFPENSCPVEITVHPEFFFEKVEATPYIPALGNKIYSQPITGQEMPPEKKRKVVTLTSEKRGLDRWVVTKNDSNQVVPYEPKLEVPEHITFKTGDLLDSKMQTLVNTVNCKGVMGRGIALKFKHNFPAMFKDYEARCSKKEVQPGIPYLFKTDEGKLILNFPTKNDWKNPSRLHWIQTGLEEIKKNYKEWGIESLAIPPLGCGNGGLIWEEVRKMMVRILGDVAIPIEIYAPTTK